MPERLLRLEDIRHLRNPEGIVTLFQRLGYNVLQSAQPLPIQDLELPVRSTESIWDAYLIADQRKGTDSLQVLLFQLNSSEWESPSLASNRMRSIANSLCKRPSNFLLLGTKDYDQLMLVNPRKSFDAQMNLKVGIRKLLIDRTNPTPYDLDRLEAIAAHNLVPKDLYKVQCDAFDVERLTKRFYQDYRSIFEQVQQVIKANNPHAYFDDTNRLHQFAQRLLGRIMFLYFLQKKGFLAGDRSFLKTQYRRLQPDPDDTDFYDTVLEPLFFDILNRQRSDMDSPWGKIPYLNGGLFDRDYGEGSIDPMGWATPETVRLPNVLFDVSGEKGILKFFNSYSFTISENVQGDEDVAIDPEMLGKVFENLLATEERGQSGAFYTPRGIVQFMCVEALSHYLADETGIDLEIIRKLTEFDPDLPDIEINKLLTKEQARTLKRALETVKVCDPAVGSGAFPMGMMQVILAVRKAISYQEGETIKRGSLRMSELKRDIIANNLYGVDIKPEAIEIAKLRMWLSMVVDKAPPADHHIQALTWEPERSVDDFVSVFRSTSFLIAQKELTPDGWRLGTPATLRLLEKLRNAGQPLGEYVNGRFYRGVLTGLNEAFVVDRAICNQLISEHPSSAEVLKPFLRGRDVKRWRTDFAEQYLIRIESSENKQHPWSGKSEKEAERIFAKTYPAIHARFERFRAALIKRDDQGKYFWELRSCRYWQEFEQPKILYQEIATYQAFAWDDSGAYSNNKTFLIPDASFYLLGLLNSNVAWFFLNHTASKLQGGAYAMQTPYISQIPIPQAADRQAISTLVQKCLDARGQRVETWEAEINDRVAHLYGLTSDDVKLIRGE
jgi:hypothetical protein